MIQNKGKSAVTNILRDEDLSHDLTLKTFLCLILEMFQYGWSANSNQGFGEAPGVKKQVLDIIRSGAAFIGSGAGGADSISAEKLNQSKRMAMLSGNAIKRHPTQIHSRQKKIGFSTD